MRKGLGMNLLRVLVSVGALIFLFRKIGLGETLDQLRRADLRYLLVAFLVFVLSLVVRAYRWLVLLRGLDPTVSFGRLLRLYFVGQFFNTFLPSQFGGDVVRALELTQDTESAAAVGTVLLDRMTGLMVLAVMGLIALPFQAAQMAPWLVWLMLGVTGAILAGGALVLEGRFLRWLTARLPSRLSLAGQGPVAKVYAAVTGCGWRAVGGAFAVSIGFNLMNVAINWLCGRAVGIDVGLGYFFAVTPLLAVSGLVPSIGGWGVREGVSTAIFAPTGAGENAAAALGVSLGLVTLAAGLVGGVVYALEGLRGLRAGRGE